MYKFKNPFKRKPQKPQKPRYKFQGSMFDGELLLWRRIDKHGRLTDELVVAARSRYWGSIEES